MENKDNSNSNMQKVALTALAGTSIEWYDFFLYGAAAALIFPTAFFGEATPSTALILSLLTFAAGFIARPIGGIIFGHYGDRVGRKKTLVIALILMGVSSTLIGLLPTYAMIGVTAPILLTALRFAQGLAIGGQWGGAMLGRRKSSLLCNVRLAHICRRRLTCLLAMDRRGTVAVVEEVV